MIKIAFTLCSNNYLAQASLVVKSFLECNTDYRFYIGLIDKKLPNIEYPNQKNITVLPCEEIIEEQQLAKMALAYKIVELNTSVKPFYIDYFFKQYNDCKIIYLDPDIYVYHSFKPVEQLLDNHDVIITPHCLTPIPLDGKLPQERTFIKYGIYNLGFCALRKTENSINFITWLKERLANYCYSELKLGMFVDQAWINLLPIFFEKIVISKDFGMNCAYWNLHERSFIIKNNTYLVNKLYPLIFFHFSALDLNNIESLSKYQTRFNFHDRPDIKNLFEAYSKALKEAKTLYPPTIACTYTKRTWLGKVNYYWNRYKIRKKMLV